jgi:aspartate carbamoyltransferase catalytic subunit
VTALSPRTSSTAKGETLIDTAATLNAMKPDVLVVRHGASGAAALLSQKVGCAVVNAGDGRHEHPTQALLDLLSLRRAFGDVGGLTVAICGDIAHSRVARSNVSMLSMMGARVRLIGPPTLVPGDADRWGCEVFHDMREGPEGLRRGDDAAAAAGADGGGADPLDPRVFPLLGPGPREAVLGQRRARRSCTPGR